MCSVLIKGKHVSYKRADRENRNETKHKSIVTDQGESMLEARVTTGDNSAGNQAPVMSDSTIYSPLSHSSLPPALFCGPRELSCL